MGYDVAAVIIAATSLVAGVTTSVVQMQAQDDQAKNNAAIQRGQALQAQQEAAYAAAQIRRRNLQVLGSQRAQVAKSGLEISGSATDVINDSAVQGEMDAMAALYSGKTQSALAMSRANNFEASRGDIAAAGYLGVGNSLIGAAGTYYKIRANSDKTISYSGGWNSNTTGPEPTLS